MIRYAPLIALAAVALAVMAVSILPPCPTEDSTNCIWDASKRGNGQGQSFVGIGGTVIFIKM